MSFYKYTAKNEHAETVKGKVEARNKQAAAAVLANRDLLVIDITDIDENSLKSLKSSLFGIKQDEVVNITRQLSTMITAGLPLNTALSILAEQSETELSSVINDLLREIEGGKTFSAALAKHPKIFSRVYVQLVRAGEAGGVLDEILARLADTMEKQKEFRGKTKGALIYPIIVLIAMVIVGLVMMIFVIPQLTKMYEDFGAELPLMTQILIDFSSLLARFWWLFFGLIGVGAIFFFRWKKTEAGEEKIDRFLLKMPVFGKLKQKVILTEFSRTLSLLLSAGVSLVSSLEIVAEAIDNVIYRHHLDQASDQVERGVRLSLALSRYQVFPPILHQMISVGEETGKLDEVLMKIAIYFETESEQAIKNLTTALEPAIMVVLGVGVGLLVVAIIMPIYNLTSQF